MTPLGPDARTVIARARLGEGPTPAERAQLRARLERVWSSEPALVRPSLPPMAAAVLWLTLGFWAPESPHARIALTPVAVRIVASSVPASALPPSAADVAHAPELSAPPLPSQPQRQNKPDRPRVRRAKPKLQSAAAPTIAAAVRAELEPSTDALVQVPLSGLLQQESGNLPTQRRPAFAAQPLEAELRWLSEAQTALQHQQPTRALALVEQHAFRYPDGALAPERRAVQALALCALGRKSAAQTVLASAEAQGSVSLFARVRRRCGL